MEADSYTASGTPTYTPGIDVTSDINYEWFFKPDGAADYGTTTISTDPNFIINVVDGSYQGMYKAVITHPGLACSIEDEATLTVNEAPEAFDGNDTVAEGDTTSVVVTIPTGLVLVV